LGYDNVDPKMSKYVSSIKNSEKLISESRNLENVRTFEKSSQTNVVDKLVATNTKESPSENLVTNHEFVVSTTAYILLTESPKENPTISNVALEVMTSWVQSDNHNETTQDAFYQESESKSVSGSGSSQHKVSNDK